MTKFTLLLACTNSLLAASAALLDGAAVARRADVPGLFSMSTFWVSEWQNKLRTKLRIGSQGTELNVVADLGSELAWVYGPNNYTWGSHYLGGPWHCGIQVSPYFQPNLSTTASITKTSWREAYGGSSKIIRGYELVRDTVRIVGTSPEDDREANVGFYTANLTTIRFKDENCTMPPAYSSGIFGLNHLDRGSGTDFRSNIKAQGLIQSNTMSVFLRDSESAPLNATIYGEVLLGGIDTSAYIGDLVVLNGSLHVTSYEVPVPTFSVGGQNIEFGPNDYGIYKNAPCVLDTGAAGDTWPIPLASEPAFLNKTGLIRTRTYYAWPGRCADIPADKTFDFTWLSKSGSRNITIEVPYRNYARGGLGEVNGACLLNFELIGCTLGQPFLSATYAAFDDDNVETAFAQAGKKDGERIAIPFGGKIPGAVY